MNHFHSNRFPILITGITGVAGFNAFHDFRRKYPNQVIGIRPRDTWGLQGERIVALDAEDRDGVRRLFEHHRFRAVLNCHGNCALKSCELDPAMAVRLNVASARNIIENVKRHGSRLVHLSTDLVFSGAGQGGHVETDAVDPVTIYGKTMVVAEELIQEQLPDAAILRISLPMGLSFNRHAGAIDWIQSRFRAGRPATLYYDEVRSCTYVDDLNRVFERFLDGGQRGLYHVGGPRAITLFQIAQVVNRVGGYDPRLLKGCPRIEAGPMPPRAGNVSMRSDKLIGEMGENPFQPWPFDGDLFPTDRDWHWKRQEPDWGSPHSIAQRLYAYGPVECEPSLTLPAQTVAASLQGAAVAG